MFVRLRVFATVKILVEVFCVVTLCSVVVGYQHFGGPYWLHLQYPPKRWCLTAKLHGVTTRRPRLGSYIFVFSSIECFGVSFNGLEYFVSTDIKTGPIMFLLYGRPRFSHGGSRYSMHAFPRLQKIGYFWILFFVFLLQRKGKPYIYK
jgi:hypothetical protein